ncbi:MAG: hypothetical protein PHV08_08050 [Sulfurovaceae bacterium]|nr:hypothetical protein [Sulfurovaceae bacterium]
MMLCDSNIIAVQANKHSKIHLMYRTYFNRPYVPDGTMYRDGCCMCGLKVDADICIIDDPANMQHLENIINDKRFCTKCRNKAEYWVKRHKEETA